MAQALVFWIFEYYFVYRGVVFQDDLHWKAGWLRNAKERIYCIYTFIPSSQMTAGSLSDICVKYLVHSLRLVNSIIAHKKPPEDSFTDH